ncbi:hypothetical protein Pth03_30810 [Planotetraspora thailandica]|uniref:TIGR04222 domain-containing membrane protein n=1 Tax=Planotetraspora thailandica TaxID=487172 RepID=A0A8J3UZW0_9ACTN|nr:TIGR04222 domain-containing membrane protein [Planotetraspora thailandica]GII54692.1 hypothetical protein Pth03_30810 [Planotetraspora thailandica]
MTDFDDLGLYEAALLCGGPTRVAMVALIALLEDGRVSVYPQRHRVTVNRRDSRDAVEAAVLEAIPGTGRPLGATMAAVATSPAVEVVGRSLREAGLLGRGGRPGLVRGSRLRRSLTASAEQQEGLRRVAIAGAAGIGDAALRRIFEAPDLRPESLDVNRRGRFNSRNSPGMDGDGSALHYGGYGDGGGYDGGGGGGGGGGGD